MIRVEEALNKILDAVSPLGMEKVNILDARGRVIGEDVYAGRAIPPKDNSAMDGYALRAGDTRGASAGTPAMLEVVEEIPAGTIPEKRIGPGQAAHRKAIAHVGAHRHVREQRIVLKHRVERAAVDRQIVDHRAVKPDLACAGRNEAADQPQDGGLARARGAEDDQKLAILDRQVDILQNPGGAVGLGHATKFDQSSAFA